MDLRQVADAVGAELLTPLLRDIDIQAVCAGDRVSDLLSQAHDRAVLVSGLPASQLVRVAELMDAPAVCLAGGRRADEQAAAAAVAAGVVLLSCPLEAAQVRSRLAELMADAGAGPPPISTFPPQPPAPHRSRP